MNVPIIHALVRFLRIMRPRGKCPNSANYARCTDLHVCSACIVCTDCTDCAAMPRTQNPHNRTYPHNYAAPAQSLQVEHP